MDQTKFISYAKELKSYIIKHDHATTQIMLLDSKISHLTKMTFSVTLDGNEMLAAKYERQLSVKEGVRFMYDTYRKRVWQKVQELSAHIASEFDTDDALDIQQNDVLPSSGTTQQVDKMANPEMKRFCSYSRNL